MIYQELARRAKAENWKQVLEFDRFDNYPKIGEKRGCFTMLSAWVTKSGILEAYTVKCDCGMIHEFVSKRKAKEKISKYCKICIGKEYPKEILLQFDKINNDIGMKSANRLYGIWKSRRRSKAFFQEWKYSFEKFAEYMITVPNYDNISLYIDRINTLEPYVPGNVRFVSPRENSRNRIDTIYIEVNGTKISFSEFIESEFGIKTQVEAPKFYHTLLHKFKIRNWPAKQLIEYAKSKIEIWPSPETFNAYIKQREI